MGEAKSGSHIPIAPNVREALAVACDVFQRCGINCETGSLVLGGGTVLASRWVHRISTDLDFFIDPHDFYRVAPALKKLASESRIDDVESTSGFCKFVADGTTPVSLFTTRSFFLIPPTQREVSTNIRLEHTTEILAKKMYGRVMQNGDFTQRDFYDFCIASIGEPESWQALASRLSDDGVVSIIDELRNPHSSPLIRNANKGDDIIEPNYPLVARHLWEASLGLMRDGRVPEWMHARNGRTRAESVPKGPER